MCKSLVSSENFHAVPFHALTPFSGIPSAQYRNSLSVPITAFLSVCANAISILLQLCLNVWTNEWMGMKEYLMACDAFRR